MSSPATESARRSSRRLNGCSRPRPSIGGFVVDFDEQPWGSDYYLKRGQMMPEDGHEIVAAADATLFGAVGSPEVSDTVTAWGLILATRQQLELYLNLRPVRSFPPAEASLVRYPAGLRRC